MEAPYGMTSELAEETSQQFVGRWMRLVSTTNWEKGRIIAEWRQALIDAGAGVQEYSDEAWSRRLGNISSQHAGRLRRTYTRFASTYAEYQGLFWSHFQAALDWEDAEMWLEGAAQSGWSVSEMRRSRAETLGTVAAGDEPTAEVVSEEFDEDAEIADSATDVPRSITPSQEVLAEEDESIEDELGDEDEAAGPYDDDISTTDYSAGEASSEEPLVRPFAQLAELPPDLSDAFESFKLAILRHKLAGWSEVALDDVVAALHALEQLAAAPSSS